MKTAPLLEDILAHLRAAGGPVASRELAARFLRIDAADEETCRRLLAPLLSGVRGAVHVTGAGWSLERRTPPGAAPAGAPLSAGRRASPAPTAAGPPSVEDAAGAGEDEGAHDGTLLDYVALAVDGVGPGGSGAPRALAYVPVVDGETLPMETLPVAGDEAEEAWRAGADGDAETTRARRPRGALAETDLALLAEAVGDLPIVVHRVAREAEPLRRAAEAAGLSFHPRVVSLARLGHLLLGLKANHPLAEMARALAIRHAEEDDCRGRAGTVARAFREIVPRLHDREVRTVDQLLEFQDLPAAPIDLTGRGFTADDLRALPAAPGVYRFHDAEGAVLYVGKAKNLRARIATYFMPSAALLPKGRAILERAHRIEITRARSDLEAALLEAAWIEEMHPSLNRQFEVHERPAPYGPRRNLVLVLPDAGATTITLHLLRGGRYARRFAGLATADLEPGREARTGRAGEILAALRLVYFSPDGGAETQDAGGALLASFLRRHRDGVNVLDVDECPGAEAALGRLLVLARAACLGGDRIVAR